jgi:methyl-accepting chemotaxis protein
LFGKVLIVIAIFGLSSISSLIYSTGAIRGIDESYSIALEHEALGATYLARASRSLYQATGAIADLEISTTEAGNHAAMDDFNTAHQALLSDLTKIKAALPAYASAVDELSAHSTAVLDVSCAKALKMGLAATGTAEVAAAQAEYLASCQPAMKPVTAEFQSLGDKALADATKISNDLTDVTKATVFNTWVAVLSGLAVVITIAYFAINSWISRPVKAISAVMSRLAEGDLGVEVLGGDRRDELGPMARAVQVFKDNGLKLKASEAEAERHRQAAEVERKANEAARAEIQRQQEAVVAALASGLDHLANGDLTSQLNQNFSAEYEKLRADFNATAASLRDAMRTISTATNGISTGSDQIASASDDLSRRTEQQAASLEETAAALNTITDTVKKMAANAGEAANVVAVTRDAAESSGLIVQQAVDAMGKIKDSSQQITNIIGVIDEIAFQTNLLALNAGVEAARAGDAGRGFAVVASEVRALAQRSAEAAKQIKGLIQASTTQVETGVALVDRTGSALQNIIGRVAAMDGLVREISASSREQASGLAEINTAISQMDQAVQQNAAMVEESTAAAHTLKGDARALMDMVQRFQTGEPSHAA